MLKQSLLFPLKIAAGATLLLTMAPSSARASILWGQSQGILEVDNFWYDSDDNPWYNEVTPSLSIVGFDEEQQVTLDRPIGYQTLNEWDNITNLSYLEPGLVVDSHMVYLAKTRREYEGRWEASATIKFSGIIVGLIGDSRLLYRDNDLFAPDQNNDPQTWHSLGPEYGWSLEEPGGFLPGDVVTILDQQTIRVNFTTHSALDPLRVLTLSPTQPVPEPLTILGAGSAIAIGGFFKSKVKNKAKEG
ncbi:PEP-CTERM sorting domain-containing protein [Cyanothece sp. BG0011]|uniref:PEP-CTERM sorting domain-containing protein n=1 Tax=Cyanothece sp. BG0011 TaxID=2082950 RepID=UPI000D1FDA96|nr:PEP-CTERM sorting domain-containing protein [Cyanothece sp. BG0011]